MSKSTKNYIYYVGGLSRYVILPADNAREALEAGEQHPILEGSIVLIVRLATKEEIDLANWPESLLDPRR